MSPSQEENLRYVKHLADDWIEKKYRDGAAEHKSDLFDMDELSLVNNAVDEAIDQVVFLLTLRRRMLADISRLNIKV